MYVFDLLALYSLGHYSIITELLAVSGLSWFDLMPLGVWGLFSNVWSTLKSLLELKKNQQVMS